MGLIRTGKFIEKALCAELHQQYSDAMRTPAMVVMQRHLGPRGRSDAQLAHEAVNKRINEACVALGCAPPKEIIDKDGDPAIINYGVDFNTGEVLEWDGVY